MLEGEQRPTVYFGIPQGPCGVSPFTLVYSARVLREDAFDVLVHCVIFVLLAVCHGTKPNETKPLGALACVTVHTQHVQACTTDRR